MADALLPAPNDGLPSTDQMLENVHQAPTSQLIPTPTIATDSLSKSLTGGTVMVAPTPAVPLAHSESPDADAIDTYDSYIWLRRYVPKVIALALTAQGLLGIYHALTIIFVDLPKLDAQLQAHQIDQTTVNAFGGKAVVTFISTILSMLFATHLAFLKSKAAHIFHTIVGVMIFMGNTLIQNYFIEIGSISIIAQSTALLFNNLLKPLR